MEYQHTIKNEASISGVGLHTGNKVTLNFKPAPANHGVSFKRIDLESQPIIEASASYVTETERSTTICKNGVKIQTPEHLLAACAGLKIDNILIEINAEELPILDGSSIEFIKCLKKAELHKQNAIRKYFVIKEEINFEDPETGAKIQALPADEFNVSIQIDYESIVLGNQTAELKNIEQFESEFSNARTFCFLHELELLSNNGLIKGGDLNNAIVYVEREVDKDELKRQRQRQHDYLLFQKAAWHVCKDNLQISSLKIQREAQINEEINLRRQRRIHNSYYRGHNFAHTAKPLLLSG